MFNQVELQYLIDSVFTNGTIRSSCGSMKFFKMLTIEIHGLVYCYVHCSATTIDDHVTLAKFHRFQNSIRINGIAFQILCCTSGRIIGSGCRCPRFQRCWLGRIRRHQVQFSRTLRFQLVSLNIQITNSYFCLTYFFENVVKYNFYFQLAAKKRSCFRFQCD